MEKKEKNKEIDDLKEEAEKKHAEALEKLKKENEQKEEYLITIANKLGEESVVIVPKGQMEEENFEIDNVVFLDDEGLIEQAYDKEDE